MKPLTLLGILAVVFTACFVGYIFTADTLFAPEEKEYKVGLVTVLESGFDPFILQIAEGVYWLSREKGVEIYSYIENSADNLWYVTEGLIGVDDVDIIVSGGIATTTAITSSALAHPTEKYLVVDSEYAPGEQPFNLANIVFRSNEPSYVAGYAAGMVTESKIIGFMGGMETEVVRDFQAGFAAGIERAERERGCDIVLITDYTGSFTDPNLGYEAAMQMYDAGVDIVYQVAATCGTGAIEAAMDSGKYVIGVDVDQSYLAPNHVIFSVVKDIPLAIYDTVLRYKAGEDFGGQTLSFGYADGDYVSVSGYLEDVIPQSVIAKAEVLEQEIAEGKIIVPKAA